jgi:hypothetical protein
MVSNWLTTNYEDCMCFKSQHAQGRAKYVLRDIFLSLQLNRDFKKKMAGKMGYRK